MSFRARAERGSGRRDAHPLDNPPRSPSRCPNRPWSSSTCDPWLPSSSAKSRSSTVAEPRNGLASLRAVDRREPDVDERANTVRSVSVEVVSRAW